MKYYLDFLSALVTLGIATAIFFLGVVFYSIGGIIVGSLGILGVTALIDTYL